MSNKSSTTSNQYSFHFSKILINLFSNNLLVVLITLKGIPYILAKVRPPAFFLLDTINFIFIGKLYLLELCIKAFKLLPLPEIKTQQFFFKNTKVNILKCLAIC